ncbi:hypothetical protein HYS00_01585 [Candidatus Microgenomates bacterium]|nr:hypothetical protein [Candidatus Microgenomates bacterium]
MKHTLRIVTLLLIVLLPFGIFAQEQHKNVVLPANQTAENTYFGAGGDVQVDGTVNGDAYVAGGTVTVNGRINGDLLAAGGTVLIRGTVTQDIRVAGGTVTITGDVGRNVTVAGGTVILDKGARVRGNVIAGAGTFSQLGTIEKDLFLGGGTATLGGTTQGNVQARSDTLRIPAGSMIAGNLTYTSMNDAQVEQGASVSGKLQHTVPPQPNKQVKTNRFANAMTGFLWGKIISLISMFLIGLLFLTFFPRFTERVVETVKNAKGTSTLAGMGMFFAAPIVIIFLLLTLIGIPFAIAALSAWVMLMYVGKLFVAMYLGQWASGLTKRTPSDSWTLFIGLVIHLLITLIPFIGWLVGGIIMFWGSGAYLKTEIELFRAWKKKGLL